MATATGRPRRTWHGVAACAAVLVAACGDDSDPRNADAPDGVTQLLEAMPDETVDVEGALLFRRSDPGGHPERIVMCDRIGLADVEDVPWRECKGAEIDVDTDVQLHHLDLGWDDADGLHDVSRPVVVTGVLDGGEFEVTGVEQRGAAVTAVRPDLTIEGVEIASTPDLCSELPGATFGVPDEDASGDSTTSAGGDSVDDDPGDTWQFSGNRVDEVVGDAIHSTDWHCTDNWVVMSEASVVAFLAASDGRLVLHYPDGRRDVQYD